MEGKTTGGSASVRAHVAVSDDDAEVISCGTASAQCPGGSSVYGLLPKPFSSNLGIESGTELEVAYHVPTQTFLIRKAE